MPMSRWSTYLVLAGLLAVAFHSGRAAEPDPKTLVEQAIKAHGGEAELKKVQISTSQFKGKIQSPAGELDVSGEVASDKDVRQRVALQLEVGGMKVEVLSVLTNDSGWVKVNDVVIDLDADKVAEAREQSHGHWVATLVPLRGPEYKLAGRGEVKVLDKPAYGVIASRDGRRDVQLFFDKETHLLVKTEQRVKDEAGKELTEESYFSNFEEKNARQPMKVSVRRDDMPYMDAEVTSFQTKEKLEDSLFQTP
jgi:hypothetical protein